MNIFRTFGSYSYALTLFIFSVVTNAASVAERHVEQNLFENAPHVVVQVEPTQEDEKRERTAATREAVIAWGTVVLAAVTLCLWLATARLAKDASNSSAKQLAVAAEGAQAMMQVAEATRNNATLMSGMLAKQMRAFLSINMVGAVSQNQTLRFEGAIGVENAGLTPARNVGYWIVARVMDPHNPDLTKPANIEIKQHDMTLNPRSSFNTSAVVDDRFSEEAVKEICAGAIRRLFLWGEIIYDDEYGGQRTSKFCHTYVFFPGTDGIMQSRSYFHRTHNSST